MLGLSSALRWLAKGFSERSGIEIETGIAEMSEALPQEAAIALFRISQEALANIHRHSRSSWARIALHRTGRQVRLEIADRGCGFKRSEQAEDEQAVGVGISGMRLRLEQLGGRLKIKSGRSGTRVIATLALDREASQRRRRAGVMLRLLLADDHDIVRRGMKELLEEQVGWSVCAEAADGRAAVELALAQRPHVAILDLSMPELNGLEATRRIKEALPETEVLVFSMHDSEELIRDVLAAGARGYLLKSDASRQLVAAVETLARHQPFFSGRVSEIVLGGFLKPGPAPVTSGPRDRLTSREREVVQLLAEGKSNKQIATVLDLSVKTVETHRTSAMRKLGLKSLPDLVRFAIRNRIVEA